jgi:hypothetical protein
MKNVIVTKLDDGVLEVKIHMLNITTYAKDAEDVAVAVDEAVESLKIHVQREGCLETFQLIKHFLE